MSKRTRMGALVAFGIVLACGCGTSQRTAAGGPSTTTSPLTSPTSSPTSSPPPPTPTSIQSTPTPIAFQGSSAPIDSDTRARMTDSWRPGCPVAIEDLRLLTMDYWGFDGAVHTGEMIVNRMVARDVLKVFGTLFGERFPIDRMELIDVYGADDDLSMAADNTSAFNCRLVTGGTTWSEHSYGWAIDINPVRNPYVVGDTILPPSGKRYVDRSNTSMGMIHAGDAVVQAFASIGWTWGGSWQTLKDYQHFSATGK